MAKTFIPSQKLDFANYKSELKNFLKAQDKFKDYDFEGSNFNVLLDILAYNTYNNAHYLNMVGSEMFLDTALLRESIVSHAKELNYTPRSRSSARATVSVEIVPTDSPSTIIIPRYYAFKTNSTSGSIKFITDQNTTVARNTDGRYIANNITIYEGDLVTERFDVNPVTVTANITSYNQLFILQSENIDTTSIEVRIFNDATDNVGTIYEKAESLYGLHEESLIYFIRGHKRNQYAIEFGDGILGKALQYGNIVQVTYRDTLGDDGNGTYTFAKSTAINGYNNIYVTTLSKADGGGEREADSSIKFNAVRHFQVQDRAVTEFDYESLVISNYPEIQRVNVYGGERISQYGKVYMALKPYNTSGVVSNNIKNRIIEFIKTKTLVPEPVIVDPEYFYIGVNAQVYYNLNNTSDQEAAIKSAIYESILNLNNTVAASFDVEIYQSTVSETIKTSHDTITGASIELYMVNRWAPQLNSLVSYTFITDNELDNTRKDVTAFSSSAFITTINGTPTEVFMKDDGKGFIYLYTNTGSTTQSTGISAGTINYVTGEVKLKQTVTSYNSYITLTCILKNNDIDISLNKYAVFDTPHINIVMNR